MLLCSTGSDKPNQAAFNSITVLCSLSSSSSASDVRSLSVSSEHIHQNLHHLPHQKVSLKFN